MIIIKLMLTACFVFYFSAPAFALVQEQLNAELYTAAEYGWVEVVKNTLTKGADVNATGGDDELTSLQIASQNGHAKIIELLLGAKADVDSDTFKFSPLFLASRSGCIDCVKMLLEAGADVNSTTQQRKVPPIYIAIDAGNLKMVKLLLEAGADVNANRPNLLFIATKHGHTEIVRLLLGVTKVDVNATDKKGYTLLMYASLYGYTETVKLLLEAGADVNAVATNSSGVSYSPLSLAKLKGHNEIIKLLESHITSK